MNLIEKKIELYTILKSIPTDQLSLNDIDLMAVLIKDSSIQQITTTDKGQTLLQYLKKKLDALKTEYEDYSELFHDNISSLVRLWPYLNEDDPLDTENLCFVAVKPDEIIFCAGGDWQNPVKVSLKLINNELVCKVLGQGFIEIISFDYFDKIFKEIK